MFMGQLRTRTYNLQAFGLEQELQPLIDHGLKLQRNGYRKPMKHVSSQFTMD